MTVLYDDKNYKIHMESHDENKIYIEAWDRWGADTQIDILIEEMAELTQALLKARRRGAIFSNDVYGELADVLICLKQIELQLKSTADSPNDPINSLWDRVEFNKEHKLRKLKDMLGNK
jgi:NTP pyrophosphatase (non-canonical NTP hydrolase)